MKNWAIKNETMQLLYMLKNRRILMYCGDILKENGFCIHAEVAGQKFEKCYEFKER